MKRSLRYRALQTLLHSRFIAREEDLGHKLTDDEVREEAKYQLEILPHNDLFEGDQLNKAIRQMKNLLK